MQTAPHVPHLFISSEKNNFFYKIFLYNNYYCGAPLLKDGVHGDQAKKIWYKSLIKYTKNAAPHLICEMGSRWGADGDQMGIS